MAPVWNCPRPPLSEGRARAVRSDRPSPWSGRLNKSSADFFTLDWLGRRELEARRSPSEESSAAWAQVLTHDATKQGHFRVSQNGDIFNES
jgi:hypothetical protein